MTKKLNKKGTSLVELIAVIVIMGIIAGIAIPTTIAVINRQKRNSAVKSAENVFNAAKTILLEAAANGASVAGVSPAADGEDYIYYTTADDMVTSGDLEKNPASTDFTITIDDDNKFAVVESTITINSVTVTVNTSTSGEVTFSA